MADASVLATLKNRAPANRPSFEELHDALRLMMRIRRFEVRAKELFHAGIIKGTAHSSVGPWSARARSAACSHACLTAPTSLPSIRTLGTP